MALLHVDTALHGVAMDREVAMVRQEVDMDLEEATAVVLRHLVGMAEGEAAMVLPLVWALVLEARHRPATLLTLTMGLRVAALTCSAPRQAKISLLLEVPRLQVIWLSVKPLRWTSGLEAHPPQSLSKLRLMD